MKADNYSQRHKYLSLTISPRQDAQGFASELCSLRCTNPAQQTSKAQNALSFAIIIAHFRPNRNK